jgi:23S rRNA pseudouridine1911/1915/1917 synthase
MKFTNAVVAYTRFSILDPRFSILNLQSSILNLQSSMTRPVVAYADPHLVVVDKPAGLTTMRHRHEAAEFGRRAQRFLPTTLADLLPGMLGALAAKKHRKHKKEKAAFPGRSRAWAVHRLDKDTSGLVVFARTKEAEGKLGREFRAHTIERCYLAIVRGQAQAGRIESQFVEDRGDKRRGSSVEPGVGMRAVTNVRVVERLGDYTLVECRLETGRTHQVRIHLGETGTPICGEHVYDRPPHGKPLPDASGASRLMLHAASLGFHHPATGKWVQWRSRLPRDMEELLRQLRKGRPKRQRGS